MKWNKARTNLLIDLTIGLALVVEAVSGFVLWLVLPRGGYQGGRNPLYDQTFILTREAWLSVHDWFAVVMVVGVIVHVVLHWRWIICMVGRLWREAFARRPAATADECPA